MSSLNKDYAKPLAIELFSGTESFSKVWRENGGKSFTIDINHKFKPDLRKNIREVTLEDIPEEFRKPDVIWASPPCTTFSVASIGKHWKHGMPSKQAQIGNELLMHTLRLINLLRPKYWFIENPRGMMRTLPIMNALPKNTVTYCQYGDSRMKPTDIWNNAEWVAKSPCKNGDACHVSAPRGARTGTQGLKGNAIRSVIPTDLIQEIIGAIK